MSASRERLLRRDDMRWFRFGLGKRQVHHDPDRQRALSHEARTRFGPRSPLPVADQGTAMIRLLDGDDGLLVAVEIVREFAEAANVEPPASPFTPLGGLLPYLHVSAAAAVIGAQPSRAVQLTDPEPLLAQLFGILDRTIAIWKNRTVRVDTDALTLANRLISTAQQLRGAMAKPPPLPHPIRELMRSNNSLDVYDPSGGRVVGAFNPGKQLRESLLV